MLLNQMLIKYLVSSTDQSDADGRLSCPIVNKDKTWTANQDPLTDLIMASIMSHCSLVIWFKELNIPAPLGNSPPLMRITLNEINKIIQNMPTTLCD